MKEVEYIMTTMTENSLIIIDELCRSTSLEEGTALAIAILEKLAQSSAFVYITTHYTLLTKLHEMYLNVKVWQLETLPSGEDPRTFKLDFRHNLIPGITSVKHYGVYIVRNIWPESILKYVYDLLDKMTKNQENPKFLPIDKKVRLKYAVEAEFRKLKSQKKLTIAEINKILNQYQNDLQQLGHFIGSIHTAPQIDLSFQESLPQIRHSILDNSQNFDAYDQHQIEEDLQSVDERMKQIFTPQASLLNESLTDIETQRAEEKMKEIFTPEQSQRNPLPAYSVNADYENMTSLKKNERSLSESSCFRNISNFIMEHSENIEKLVPEINLSYEGMSSSSQNSSELAHNVFGLLGSDFKIPVDNQNFPQLQRSQNSLTKYDVASSVDLSENMDEFRFSEPLYADFSKTSTPIINRKLCSRTSSPLVQINDQNRNLSFTLSVSKSELEKLSKSNDIDMESLQEELELCSQIFEQDEDDFEETLMNSINKSELKKEFDGKNTAPSVNRPKYQHLMPKVTIIEGPNNTTLSFDGNETTGEENFVEKQINIISNVLIVAKDGHHLDRDTEAETKQNCAVEKIQVVEETKMDEESDLNETEDVAFGTWSKLYDEKFTKCRQNQTNNSADVTSNGLIMTDEGRIAGDERNEENNYFEKENNEGAQLEIKAKSEELINHSSNRYGTIDAVPTSRNIDFEENESQEEEPEVNKVIHYFEAERSNKQCENLDSSNNVDKTVMTSISNASKLRNLEQITSDSSAQEEESEKKTSDKTTTSTSSVSRKRNLDQITIAISSLNNEEAKKSTSKSETSSLKESDDSGKKKLSTQSGDLGDNIEETTKRKKAKKRLPNNRRKFVPPRKLSAKEIREEFKEQDRKILESSPSSSNYSKYLEQLIKRPSVKQIQNTTHVAYITRTAEGFEVIPAQPAKMRKKSPIRRHFSNENFDISIFSDKNARPFQQYLNSREKDYKTFSFNFKKSENSGKTRDEKFEFEPTMEDMGKYTNKSVTTHFIRSSSDIFKSQAGTNCSENNVMRTMTSRSSEISQNLEIFTQQAGVQTLTPDGFYTQNKEDINRIMTKYLENTAPVRRHEAGPSTSRTICKMRSFFENDISVSDLDI